MIANGMTISDAAHRWVSEMNAYPQEMIRTLMAAKPDDWHEVTMPRVGDRVYLFDTPTGDKDGNEYDGDESCGEITEILDDGGCYIVELDDGVSVRADSDEMEVERDGYLPMWGWMWSFSDSADEYFMEELEGVRKMSECGFRVYEHEEWGYFFGIDGCGYSFYEEHWIPAYKARGLHWHDPVAEQEYSMTMKGYEKRKLGLREYWYNGDEIVEEVLKWQD